MAELQRKKEEVKKKSSPVDVLENVLDDITRQKSIPIEEKIALPIQKPVLKEPEPKIISRIEVPEVTPPKTVKLSQLEPGMVHPNVKPILPSWVTKPWRWMIPEDPELKQQWLITWGDFLLSFARILNLHIIDIQEVCLVYPFTNPILKKKLSTPQMEAISEHLIDKERAIWWDTQKTRLRLYWKTLNSFVDEIFEYSFQNGHEMVTLYDMVKMEQSWSSLPARDLSTIMKLLVETKKATWADSEQKTIEFHFV
jgi:hypothetical protein